MTRLGYHDHKVKLGIRYRDVWSPTLGRRPICVPSEGILGNACL